MINPTRDLKDVCFVVMPFGAKAVRGKKREKLVDFDFIYREVFEPAIRAVRLPDDEGGGPLRPFRADDAKYAGTITSDMYKHLEYSRMVLADISALNVNVFFELGIRYRARESGTVVFRQERSLPPFDIADVRAFPYRYSPVTQVSRSRKLVTEVLTESLTRNRWDSPVMLALRAQAAQGAPLQDLLLHAERAIARNQREEALRYFLDAIEVDAENPMYHLKAALFYKDTGRWDDAIEHLRFAVAKGDKLVRAGSGLGDLAVAHRELGIAYNKRDGSVIPRAGEENLRRALLADPSDFDALSSLGGVLKRAGDLDAALEAYERAVEISRGHPFPLLNAIKIRAHIQGKIEISSKVERRLLLAQGIRQGQAQNQPPIDAPWCFFDLAEILIYLGEPEDALAALALGLPMVTAGWQATTFLKSLALLPESGRTLDGMPALVDCVRQRESQFTPYSP